MNFKISKNSKKNRVYIWTFHVHTKQIGMKRHIFSEESQWHTVVFRLNDVLSNNFISAGTIDRCKTIYIVVCLRTIIYVWFMLVWSIIWFPLTLSLPCEIYLTDQIAKYYLNISMWSDININIYIFFEP